MATIFNSGITMVVADSDLPRFKQAAEQVAESAPEKPASITGEATESAPEKPVNKNKSDK